MSDGTPADRYVEILGESPAAIRRPLALVDGRGYTASWIHVSGTEKGGDEPILVVLRDDGTLFTEAPIRNAKPITELKASIDLPEIPPPELIWSGEGVKRYRKGDRPDPATVFEQVKAVADHFMDFERSLGSQAEMAELGACYVMATYFLDAFSVIGYLWSNGEPGSGKTHLLHVISQMAYLGQMILAGGSYASLRDMAGYGATLCFDDAESITDSRAGDPDKQALLLAGNRKGMTVSLKVPKGNRGWETKHIHAYCPRLFSAVKLPNDVLGSRTIVVPLIASDDPRKANSDPLDSDCWPQGVNRRRLIDDLWALGLSHLSKMPVYDKRAAELTDITGRPFQPWRAIHAVALWLDESGVKALYERIAGLTTAYRQEHLIGGTSQINRIVLQALREMIGEQKSVIFATSELKHRVNRIAEVEGVVEPSQEYVTAGQLGKKLARFRLRKPETRNSQCRQWEITEAVLARLERGHGILTDYPSHPTQASHVSPDGETDCDGRDTSDGCDNWIGDYERKDSSHREVTCGKCEYFVRDDINPASGLGACKRNHTCRYPNEPHNCTDYTEPGT